MALPTDIENSRSRAAALKAVGEYVRSHSAFFARRGPQLLAGQVAEQQSRCIEALGEKIDALAVAAQNGSAKYEEFETILGELHKEGFTPEPSLVSAVARTFAASQYATTP